MNRDIPSIIVFSESDNPYVREIIRGIEEEGIPYLLEIKETKDVVAKSYEAASQSRLSTGVAINSSRVAVHHAKLNSSKPLFDMDLRIADSELLRNCGCNAARLVKGVPFKLSE